MRTKNLRIAAISFGVMTFGFLSSCTSESGFLNQIPGGSSSTFNLVQTPDVVVYSGNNYFNASATASSRSIYALSSRATQSWEQGLSFDLPAGAVDITKPNFDKSASIYYIPEDFEGELDLNWAIELNGNHTIYNFGKLTGIKNCNFAGIVTFYNIGTMTWSISSGGRHKVYNCGTLEVNSYANIGEVYNVGDLILSKTYNPWWNDPNAIADIPNEMSIFSSSDGLVTITDDADFKAKCDIHSTIHIEGNIKFQNSSKMYICGIEATTKNGSSETRHNIDIVADNFSTSYIKCGILSIDGKRIYLSPEGHIDCITYNEISNSWVVPSSGSYGMLEANEIILKNETVESAFHQNGLIYIYCDKISRQGNKVDGTSYSYINPTEKVSGTPECGEAWGAQPETPPTVDPDPEDPDDPDPDPTPGPTPNPPSGVMKYSNNVEINLSLEKHNIQYTEYQATHVSIHVRHATDVEVSIPLPLEYVCEADDFAIVAKHDYDETRIPKEEVRQFTIANDEGSVLGTVTMTIEHLDNGTKIKTDGINQNIIDYLSKKYGDGLTFEVWVYTNIEHSSWETGNVHGNLSKALLKVFLNETKVKFLDDEPDLYVNSFNSNYNFTTSQYEKFEDDYIVDIDDTNKPSFYTGVQGSFLNGSNFNILYYNKSAK